VKNRRIQNYSSATQMFLLFNNMTSIDVPKFMSFYNAHFSIL